MPKVSVIIPVYGVEKYIRECLDSICAQTFTDWECIVVDDGSTDNSGQICDEYATLDSRFKVFHKENGGVSSARNYGLNMAVGDYIAFVDSDDTILPNMFEDLVGIAETTDCSIVQSIGPVDKRLEDSGKIWNLTRQQVLDDIFKFTNVFKPSLWLGIYKKSLFDDVRLPVDIHFYEDFSVLTLLASNSNGVTFIGNRYYNYVNRDGSANHCGLSPKFWTSLKIPQYLENHNVYRNQQDRRNVISFFTINCLLKYIISEQNATDRKIIKNEIKRNFITILRASAPKLRLRIVALVFIFFPKLVSVFSKPRIKY